MQRQLSAINIRRNNHNNVVNQRMMDGNVVDVLDVIGQSVQRGRMQLTNLLMQILKSLHSQR